MKKNLAFITLSFITIVCSAIAGVGGAVITTQLLDDETTGSTKDVIQQDVRITNEESAIIQVAETASPSVVSIVVSKDVPVYENFYYDPFGGSEFFFPERRQNGTEEQQVGAGSGFIISDEGLIITNRHVVEDENASYTVIMNDGTQYDATVLARDTLLDIAFIEINGGNLIPLELGSSSELKVGQTVIAIGNALGEFSNSVSSGIVSGLKRDIVATSGRGMGAEELTNVIQTDASINPGNSGGPLLDSNGNVIGVNVAVASGAENIGFAIPIDVVKDLLERFGEDGEIDRPVLGVRYMMLTPDVIEENDLQVDHGAIIIRGSSSNQLAVIPGSPADKAGLRENDIILEINGIEVTPENTLQQVIQSLRYGDVIEVTYSRGGEEFETEIELIRF